MKTVAYKLHQNVSLMFSPHHFLLSVPEQTHGNMSDQDRISPYNINTISSRQVMRIKKNINYLKGLLVDPISNSPN